MYAPFNYFLKSILKMQSICHGGLLKQNLRRGLNCVSDGEYSEGSRRSSRLFHNLIEDPIQNSQKFVIL